MRLLGFIFILVSLMVGIGSNLSSFIDAPSLIFVIPGALALLLFAGQGVGNMFGAVFSADATSEQLTAAADAWEHTGIYAQAMGGIGTIIGLVLMLKNMDDPAALGPGMAIALLTVFYGLFVAYAVALPLQTRLRSRAAG
ncbi:MAG: hypothetical protein CME24_07920 [Gemmatimonadetes bacterium]|nr:hypothetical protein [Gemmatimonadota bacterium]|tara:strand:- start:1459 stop:1878 length:420 start_codon:yes stop_codon:yes gene_type:complete